MFVHTSNIKKIITIPTYILDDNTVSLAAKGLYVQLLYSNNSICSLKELTAFTNETEDNLQKYFAELSSAGYITIKDKRCDLLQKAVTDRSSRKTSAEDAEEFAENVVVQKPLNKYEKMEMLINSFDLSDNVKHSLLVYFEKRLNKRGRFAEAEDLHGYIVRAMIGDLISFHLSEEDQITCIQQSIDREWFKFVNPVNQTQQSKAGSAFNKENIKAGTYTKEDIDEIKRKSAELEANGEKGFF